MSRYSPGRKYRYGHRIVPARCLGSRHRDYCNPLKSRLQRFREELKKWAKKTKSDKVRCKIKRLLRSM